VDSIVTATDVRRRFGEGDAAVNALAGVSVGFERGRFSAIMGPSGSGKSTLMHILAGLDRPTSGTVAIDGVDLTGLDDGALTRLRRDKLGFIFQFFNLIPVLTAEENVALPLSIAGVKPDASTTGARTGRPSSRAASSSASRWPARSPPSRR
jgi:putative ABC transport system ATP-binding protein